VGFNPFRARVARRGDLWFVALGLAVTAALVAWALLGW
jgi:hypothetical protein